MDLVNYQYDTNEKKIVDFNTKIRYLIDIHNYSFFVIQNNVLLRYGISDYCCSYLYKIYVLIIEEISINCYLFNK